MKKIRMLFLLLFIFVPLIGNAETCDSSKISIQSITLESKSNTVEELELAKANGNSIDLNLKMSALKDTINYKFIIKNDSDKDFIIKNDSFNLNSDYINYVIESEDNSDVVKAKSLKEVSLKIEYLNKIPNDKYNAGQYDDNNTMVVNLTTGGLSDILTNPNTGNKILLLIIALVIVLLYAIVIKKKNSKAMILVIGLSIFIPISVYATCSVELKINSNIQFINKGYMPCTFDGEMIPGAEFVYGDFIYRYKQEHTMNEEDYMHWYREWVDIEEDGWGVIHKDIDTNNVTGEYTPRMCSSINGKPIVSMSYTFYMMDKIEKMDVSYIDTSNVVNMSHALYYIGGDIIPNDTANNDTVFSIVGLENWDVSKVRNMEALFYGVGRFTGDITISDFSNWDTSNVKTMRSMFTLVAQGWDTFTSGSNRTDTKCNIRDIEKWDLSNVEDVSFMFEMFGSGMKNIYFDFSNWNLSNVTNFEGMFEDFGFNAESVELRGLDKWNVSKGDNFSYMFCDVGIGADSIIIDNVTDWDISNATDMSLMFYNIGNNVAKSISFGNLSNWNTKSVKNMSDMFSRLGNENSNIIDIGTLNIYADDISGIFENTYSIKAVLNIYSETPNYYSKSEYSSNIYDLPFEGAAIKDGSLITINYSNNTTNIDNIIATKSENSHVVKGVLLD